MSEATKTCRQTRIILGIDPGYAILGWGVIRASANGSTVECLGYGAIQTHSSEEMGQRLALINRELEEIIKKYNPDEIAIEELFFGKNTKTAIKVAHARGIVLMRAVEHTGRIFEYKPSQVKLAVVGVGSADKKQIQFMVQRILGLREIPKPDDAADALAIAVAHSAYHRV
jgi:crossover junction endodeoxyribonuclease RuvC